MVKAEPKGYSLSTKQATYLYISILCICMQVAATDDGLNLDK